VDIQASEIIVAFVAHDSCGQYDLDVAKRFGENMLDGYTRLCRTLAEQADQGRDVLFIDRSIKRGDLSEAPARL
jgi:hypothetical protein